MRKILALALSASLIAVPTALADSGKQDPRHGTSKPAHMTTYEFSGKVTVVGDSSIVVAPVRAHGKNSRVALAGAVSFTVKIGETTRVTRGEAGRIALSGVRVGDRVKVEIRAPRGTALADMPTAKRVKAKPGAPAVNPTPAPAPAPVVVEPAPLPTPVVVAPAPAPIPSTENAPPPPPMLGF